MSENEYVTIHLENAGWGKPRVGPMEVIVDLEAYTQLVEALRAVEWVELDEIGIELECPWCYAQPPEHRSDCQRQAALAAVEGGGDE